MAHGDTAPELFVSDDVFFSKELPQQLQCFYWNQAHDGLSISQLFGLKGHKVSPATQNPECPIFQFSLRVCGMARGHQWIKSNDFSKILLKIVVVWKICLEDFITVPHSLIKLTAQVWFTEKQRAHPSRFSSVLLFSSLDSLFCTCEQTWQLPFLTYFLNHDW